MVLAQRGIQKQQRSGLERFMPAMFAYDLPPSRRTATDVKPAVAAACSDGGVPAERARDTRSDRVRSCPSARLERLCSLRLCCWRSGNFAARRTSRFPTSIPSICGTVLSPPVSATACTNPLGVATYLAEIDHNTDVVDLARDIAETFRADLSDGVIQQSLLHFSPQYVGNPPGLPDVVMLTDSGLVPPVRTPPDVELTATHGELFFAVNAGIDMYLSNIFAGQLVIEYHTHRPAPEKSIEADTFAAPQRRRAACRNRRHLTDPNA